MMELFSEIYGLYFQAVERVLRCAAEHPLSSTELTKILSESAFFESAVSMLPKLQSGVWPLLRPEKSGYSAACILPAQISLTTLQRAWLKALLDDRRICLFFDNDIVEKLRSSLSSVEPLYRQEDFHFFDKAADSDDYGSPEYQRSFRLLLQAIHQKSALSVQYEGGKGKVISGVFQPYKMEYSAKDDKFRAYCYRTAGSMTGSKRRRAIGDSTITDGDAISDRTTTAEVTTTSRRTSYILNVGRIISIGAVNTIILNAVNNQEPVGKVRLRQVTIEITKERNALERCLVHFAHFEKRTEYDESTDKYICTIHYKAADESEVVIRILSFGPTIKVLKPSSFINEIRNRVRKQTELMRT